VICFTSPFHQPSSSPIEPLSSCIATLEDSSSSSSSSSLATATSLDHTIASSLWSARDDLCAGLKQLHALAVSSGGSDDDVLELLKKLYALQTDVSSDGMISVEAADTAMLLDDASDAVARQQQQQQQQPDITERITMLTQALRCYEHHHTTHHQSSSSILNTLVRLHRCHIAVGNRIDSLNCMAKAVACYPEACKEEQQRQQKLKHNITSLRVMLFNAHLALGQNEQVCDV
jgi:hypothetical protein